MAWDKIRQFEGGIRWAGERGISRSIFIADTFSLTMQEQAGINNTNKASKVISTCLVLRILPRTKFVKIGKGYAPIFFDYNKQNFVWFISLLYKRNRFHVVIRLFSNRSQKTSNVVRASVSYSAIAGVPLFCSYHILTSSVIYYWSDARQHGIYLLNRRPWTWNLFVVLYHTVLYHTLLYI